MGGGLLGRNEEREGREGREREERRGRLLIDDNWIFSH